MKLRIAIVILVAFVLGTLILAKGPSMNSQYPFSVFPVKNINVEAQSFVLGLGDEDFQISVPDEKAMDQVSLKGNSLKREKIRLQEYGIGTSYAVALNAEGFFLFQGSGVLRFNADGSKQIWHASLSDQKNDLSLDGPAYSNSNGTATTFIWRVGTENGEDVSETQLVRFHPEKGKRGSSGKSVGELKGSIWLSA
jgi:hypothetical protein